MGDFHPICLRPCRAYTMQIHTDKFPQRSFVANATSLRLLQFAGDLRRSIWDDEKDEETAS